MESQNKKLTDEKRLQLAAKLDSDLDDFINSLEKKRYTDGWKPEEFEKVSEENVTRNFFSLSVMLIFL